MIKTDEGLRQAMKQLTETYQAIRELRTHHPNASPRWLALMAEGFVHHAQQLRREVEECTGLSSFEEAAAELWLAVEARGIHTGMGPASVLTALLDAFRKGVQTVAEFMSGGQ